MRFDLRLPLGLLFSIFGVILVLVGLFAPPENNLKTLGLNMNLRWGLAQLVFGGLMLAFALNARKRKEP